MQMKPVSAAVEPSKLDESLDDHSQSEESECSDFLTLDFLQEDTNHIGESSKLDKRHSEISRDPSTTPVLNSKNLFSFNSDVYSQAFQDDKDKDVGYEPYFLSPEVYSPFESAQVWKEKKEDEERKNEGFYPDRYNCGYRQGFSGIGTFSTRPTVSTMTPTQYSPHLFEPSSMFSFGQDDYFQGNGMRSYPVRASEPGGFQPKNFRDYFVQNDKSAKNGEKQNDIWEGFSLPTMKITPRKASCPGTTYQDENEERKSMNGSFQFHCLSPQQRENSFKEDKLKPFTLQFAQMSIGNTSPFVEKFDEMENIEYMIDNAYLVSKDQTGCRLLQKKLDEKNFEVSNRIFTNVIDHFAEIMVDDFGNYLCQKIIEICSSEQLKKILLVLNQKLVQICLNSHGTRAVQKLIESIKNEGFLVEKFVTMLKDHLVTLVKDIHGNHVIQKCLMRFKPAFNNPFYELITQNSVEIATHRHGCCVIQKCLDYGSVLQKDMLINDIIKNTQKLVRDPFGNYVIQNVLKIKDAEKSQKIIEYILSDIVNLSNQKFSSNVLETCLQFTDDDCKNSIIDEMCKPKVLREMLLDQYGNYVLQKALLLAEQQKREKMLQIMRPVLESLKSMAFGKKTYLKLVKMYPDLKCDMNMDEADVSPFESKFYYKRKSSYKVGGNDKFSDPKKRCSLGSVQKC